ncbi:hypothetical protein [Sulfurimonas sp.]|jgi:hypothetical protein|uniref:hypothetical protein n=1 Tax=Sulfurimonas sp. TaxID=2022749 RepID=UPI0025F49265|nr:hypothetical protein [Sulfurimonas sp.]MCK9472729.1 hypothetical protein [Sulfurimonas sp.]MDD3505233.1 hypothetical protein [Sulfurimonas sp.]
MKKVLSIIVASVAALTLTTGCGGASTGMSAHTQDDASICKSAIYIGDSNYKSVLKSIEIAGKKEGWLMTPFKANAIIGEKIIDGEMQSIKITLDKRHISCPEDDISKGEMKALRAAIVKELKKDSSH